MHRTASTSATRFAAAALCATATLWAFPLSAAEAPAPATPAPETPAPAPAPASASASAPAPAPTSAAPASPALPAGAREWSYPLGGARELDVRTSAGTVRVVVGADDRVRVRGGHRDRGDAPEVRYRVRNGVGSLEVNGRDELELVVEVPRALALAVRMSAGELRIDARDADLDVRLRAGRVTIDAAEIAAYADIDVSVLTGEIAWSDAHVRRGGLFRSYDHRGTGATKLRVRVYAGRVDIV